MIYVLGYFAIGAVLAGIFTFAAAHRNDDTELDFPLWVLGVMFFFAWPWLLVSSLAILLRRGRSE